MQFSLFPLVLAAMTTSKAYSFSSSAVGGTFLSAEQKLALKTTAELVATPGKGITGTYRTGGTRANGREKEKSNYSMLCLDSFLLRFSCIYYLFLIFVFRERSSCDTYIQHTTYHIPYTIHHIPLHHTQHVTKDPVRSGCDLTMWVSKIPKNIVDCIDKCYSRPRAVKSI